MKTNCAVGIQVVNPDYYIQHENVYNVTRHGPANDSNGDYPSKEAIPERNSERVNSETTENVVNNLSHHFIQELPLGDNDCESILESTHITFEEKDVQLFHDARHKSLCYNDNGKLVRCQTCRQQFLPIDLVDLTIRPKMHQYGLDCVDTNSSVSIHGGSYFVSDILTN